MSARPPGPPPVAPDQWRRIKETFQSALEVESSARGTFLDEACGADAWLRREVGSLLAAHEGARAFIETPALAGGLRVAPEGDPLIGTVVEGRYEIEARIGGGGMGAVYRARHLGLGTVRALKVMNREWLDRPGFVQRFENEAKVAEGLVHPHLVRVYDTARLPDGSLGIVSEYVDGETLAQRLRRRPPTLDEMRCVVAQVADGMHLAHRQGILHRDIAPDNLLVCGEAHGLQVKLLDFGIAKDLSRPGERLTGSGMLFGKLGYASPEQMGLLPRGTPPDPRTDVFSLATVAYEMLTGTLPWRRDSVQSYVHDLLVRPEAEQQEAIAARLAPAWRPVFLRALARAREARTPSMEALKDEVLAVAASGVGVAAIDASSPTMVFPASRRRSRLWAGAAAGVGVLLAIVAWPRSGRELPPPAVMRPAVVAAPTALPVAVATSEAPPSAATPAALSRTIQGPPKPAPAAETRSDSRAPEPARLILQSPTSASVLLDGQPRGRTPLTLDGLAAGPHLLTVTADDGRVVEENLELEAGKTIERRLIFRGYGSVTVVAPVWAEVSLDGGPPQQTPCRFDRVPAGRHTLRAWREGHEAQVLEVDVVEGETRQVPVDLQKGR